MGIAISNSQGFWLGFSLRSSLQQLWIMWVYIMWVHIVWVQKVSIRQYRLAEQNISWVSRKKALLARYLQNTVVSICPDSSHSSHVQGTCVILRDQPLNDMEIERQELRKIHKQMYRDIWVQQSLTLKVFGQGFLSEALLNNCG